MWWRLQPYVTEAAALCSYAQPRLVVVAQTGHRVREVARR